MLLPWLDIKSYDHTLDSQQWRLVITCRHDPTLKYQKIDNSCFRTAICTEPAYSPCNYARYHQFTGRGSDWTVRESSPGGGEISAPVQTDSGTHPPSYKIGNGFFPRGKVVRCSVNRPPSTIPRLKKEYSEASMPFLGLHVLFWVEPYLFSIILETMLTSVEEKGQDNFPILWWRGRGMQHVWLFKKYVNSRLQLKYSNFWFCNIVKQAGFCPKLCPIFSHISFCRHTPFERQSKIEHVLCLIQGRKARNMQ
jgi:hypothetical protein